jgi:hypothetical protein
VGEGVEKFKAQRFRFKVRKEVPEVPGTVYLTLQQFCFLLRQGTRKQNCCKNMNAPDDLLDRSHLLSILNS